MERFFNPAIARKLVMQQDGKIISVTFRKREDGSIRQLTGRLGVKVGVKGVGKSYDDKDYCLCTIYDMSKETDPSEKNYGKAIGFRSFGLDSVIRIKADGKVYEP